MLRSWLITPRATVFCINLFRRSGFSSPTGIGHKTASHFLEAGGGKNGMFVEPVVFDLKSHIGADYWQAMELAGRYAYAGRDWVCDRVLKIMGAREVESVHNNHNFAWKEKHFGEEMVVVRKGATPAFPGQRGFVGGSMGDISVILEGVEAELHRQDFSVKAWNYGIRNPPGSKGSDLCRCGRGRTTVSGDGVSHCDVCGPPVIGRSVLDTGRSGTRAQVFGSAQIDRLRTEARQARTEDRVHHNTADLLLREILEMLRAKSADPLDQPPPLSNNFIDAGITPNPPRLSGCQTIVRRGITTSPAENVSSTSAITSMHWSIGSSRTTSLWLIWRTFIGCSLLVPQNPDQ